MAPDQAPYEFYLGARVVVRDWECVSDGCPHPDPADAEAEAIRHAQETGHHTAFRRTEERHVFPLATQPGEPGGGA